MYKHTSVYMTSLWAHRITYIPSFTGSNKDLAPSAVVHSDGAGCIQNKNAALFAVVHLELSPIQLSRETTDHTSFLITYDKQATINLFTLLTEGVEREEGREVDWEEGRWRGRKGGGLGGWSVLYIMTST